MKEIGEFIAQVGTLPAIVFYLLYDHGKKLKVMGDEQIRQTEFVKQLIDIQQKVLEKLK